MTISPCSSTQPLSTMWANNTRKCILLILYAWILRVWRRMSSWKLKARSFLRVRAIKMKYLLFSNFSYWRCWVGERLVRWCYAKISKIWNIMLSNLWGRRIWYRNNIWLKLKLKDTCYKKVNIVLYVVSHPFLVKLEYAFQTK